MRTAIAIMELESFFDRDILRLARVFEISGDHREQTLKIAYKIEDLTLHVKYHRHIKDWKVAVDLQVDHQYLMRNVYIDNLEFKERVRKFWVVVLENQQLLGKLVRDKVTDGIDITLRHLSQYDS